MELCHLKQSKAERQLQISDKCLPSKSDSGLFGDVTDTDPNFEPDRVSLIMVYMFLWRETHVYNKQ